MKVTRTLLILISISFFIFSCTADYLINKNNLRFQWPKSDNFEISVIQVDSLGEKRTTLGERVIPVKYKRLLTVECLTIENALKLFDSSAKTIEFKPQRVIHFNKINKYYKWCLLPLNENVTQDIFPLKFEKNHWYEFSGFPENKVFGDNYTIYIFVNSKGQFRRFCIYLTPLNLD